MTRLFEKEYGLPVNSNPTDPRSIPKTVKRLGSLVQYNLTYAQNSALWGIVC